MQTKVILVTGSTRGIGFGLASNFLEKGHSVIINGRSENSVNKALEQLKQISVNVIGVVGEVQNESTFERLIETAIAKFQHIDIWINNAGIPQDNKVFWNISNKAIKNLIDVNVVGLLLGSKYAVELFEKQGYGKLFNMEGFGSNGRMMNKLTLYGSSKRLVAYFTKALSKELTSPKIQVGAISPGMVPTEFIETPMENATEKEQKQFEKVNRILAEDVEVVTQFLVEHILKSTKQYDHINFLSGFRLAGKILKLSIS